MKKSTAPQHSRYISAYTVMGFLFLKAAKQDKTVLVGLSTKRLKPGQLVTCYREVSEATGLTEARARKAIQRLEDAGKIERESCNRHSLITIVDNAIEEC